MYYVVIRIYSASIGSCTIQHNAANPVGVPSVSSVATGSNIDNATYSCVSNANCKYDVHVLSCFRSFNFFRALSRSEAYVGRSTVNISAIGQSPRPLVLVLVSSHPVEWELNIPSHVVIDLVFMVSHSIFNIHLKHFSLHHSLQIYYPWSYREEIQFHRDGVTYPPGRVLSVNKTSYSDNMPTVPRGYGEDSGGGDTVGLLQYLQDRFGDVASFSGAYGADGWRVDLILQEGTGIAISFTTRGCSKEHVLRVPLLLSFIGLLHL